MITSDEKLYEEIIAQSKKAIFFAISKYGKSSLDKEDILQECYLVIWRALKTISAINDVKARNNYIIRCCQNVCIAAYRKMNNYDKRKIAFNHWEDDDNEYFENCYFKTEENPESILANTQTKNLLYQFKTAKLLIKILKI